MTIKKKMIEVDFIGRELLNNQVFDTTIENVAKEKNIYNKEKKYGPMTIILGEKELLDKVESTLFNMKMGEEKTVRLLPKDAFGERKADFVRIVPKQVFVDQKINPVNGLIINIGQSFGKVQSVSGGRVRVDFNHPLAGREIEYTVMLKKEMTDKKEIANKIFEKYYSQVPGAKKEYKDDKLYITIPSDTAKGLEKVNSTISKLASELGTKLEFTIEKEKKK